ncbi:adenosylmethionine decarboxylase [Sphingomonas panacisoli]|uniref:Adenosylmethionine decarboxylase n=1 Tax=Sphingomonas panacisoli TaxID=1813879 RepID=A0A5B8LL23_9SPHN|nr:adenosylmethionine decarboxylase [Sphingomonas panacisoli]QDZ08282.1 adenosylmethionine decarboxylase [Sphingomonas panacisoli]
MDFTGTHLLADLFECDHLADEARIEAALRASVVASGATLLALHVHGFGTDQGVTGVALLAESHISIHSWPERGYAAVDMFLCGQKHDLDAGLRALSTALNARRVEERRFARGFGVVPPIAV